jgi:hypothetical protein
MFEGVSVVAFAVVTALNGVRQAPQGFNYTVERFALEAQRAPQDH